MRRWGLVAATWAAVAVALGAAVVPAGAHERPEGAGAGPLGARPRIGLVWSDPLRALPFPEARLGRAVASQLEPLGIEVAWRLAESGPASGDDITVVLLDHEPPGATHPAAMGVTRPGSIARTLWLVLPNVRRTLGLGRPASAASRDLDFQLARALARVVAHEVVHILAPAARHSRGGLMRASLGPAQLLAEDLPLDPAGRAALASALESPAGPGGADRDPAAGPVETAALGTGKAGLP